MCVCVWNSDGYIATVSKKDGVGEHEGGRYFVQ